MVEETSGGGSDESGSTDPMSGRVVLERYRLGRRLGSGGMGTVYEAEQLAVGRAVAIKILRADLMAHGAVRDRFRREAEVIGRLRHPHTISLIDYGETDDGLVVMVTELLLGQPLDVLVGERGALSLVETLTIGEHVAGSLSEAHGLGLVHRDLKPANVFVTRVSGEPFCKVLDFGIARVMDPSAAKITSTGQIFGTPRYMSPEQAASTADVDARSDLYSLGLVLFECATGRSPFSADTAIQYIAAHATQDPPGLRALRPDAPGDLEALVEQLLKKDPDARPPDAEAVRQTLRGLRAKLRGDSTEAVVGPDAGARFATEPTRRAPIDEAGLAATAAPGRSGPSDPGGRSTRWIGGVVLAFLVSAVGLAGVLWRPTDDVVVAVSGPEDSGGAIGDAAAAKVPAPTRPSVMGGGSPAIPDAGAADARSRDLGRAGAAPERPRPAPRPRRRPRRKPPKEADPPGGFVSGPRGMKLDPSEPDIDWAALAARCDASQWTGLSRFATSGCPRGCALLVDRLCAGRTPAEDRAIAPGRRNAVIYCDGKPYRRATLIFREGRTTTMVCP